MSKERNSPCEASVHVPNCSGLGETKDHFTPKSIAKVLGWTYKQMNEPMNLQYLSTACHREKDSTTPMRLELLKMQHEGLIEMKFGDHQRIIDNKEPISIVLFSRNKNIDPKLAA